MTHMGDAHGWLVPSGPTFLGEKCRKRTPSRLGTSRTRILVATHSTPLKLSPFLHAKELVGVPFTEHYEGTDDKNDINSGASGDWVQVTALPRPAPSQRPQGLTVLSAVQPPLQRMHS